jgi:hypothetical protein
MNGNKNLFCVIVLLAVYFSAFSQITVSAGALAGVNIANFRVVDSGKVVKNASKPLTRFQGGFVAEAKMETMNFMSVVGGLEYSQRGAKAVDTVDFVLINYLDYLSMPLLAKFKITVGPIKPFLAVGPELNFLIKERAREYLAFNGETFIDTTVEGTNSTNLFDFEVKIVVGAEMTIGEMTPFIQASYSFGLSDLNRNLRNQNPENTYSVFNNVFTIQAGLLFKIK